MTFPQTLVGCLQGFHLSLSFCSPQELQNACTLRYNEAKKVMEGGECQRKKREGAAGEPKTTVVPLGGEVDKFKIQRYNTIYVFYKLLTGDKRTRMW